MMTDHNRETQTAPTDDSAVPGTSPDNQGFQDTQNTDGNPDTAATISADPLMDLKGEVQNLKEQLLRALAEQENLRKRMTRELEDARSYSIANFARDLLSAADNLRRALDTVQNGADLTAEATQALVQGIDMTEKELLSAFDRAGIQKIHPMGDPFNHDHHQAMFETHDDAPAGTVTSVLQSGYILKNRLLRPAMVGVSKGPAQTEDDPSLDPDVGDGANT